MLPSEYLVVETRKGKISPVFSSRYPNAEEVASELIKIFESSVGERKKHLTGELRKFYDEAVDYGYNRFVKGLCVLLERRCSFRVQSEIEPKRVRELAFERGPVLDEASRIKVLNEVAEELGVSLEVVESSLWADNEDELLLESFETLTPEKLLQLYDLSLTQTLLFKAVSLDLLVKSNYKDVLRRVKSLGLMYLAEKQDNGIKISVDGPASVLKLTEKYGTAFAKLLPLEGDWALHARILMRKGRTPRIYDFYINSTTLNYRETPPEVREFDSAAEESFARRFSSLNTGWKLRRESEALVCGNSVFIPDFSFEKDGMKVYLEIIGFWTEDYMRKKARKLRELEREAKERMILAVSEELACTFKEFEVEMPVVYFKKKIPLNEILSILREYERKMVRDDHAIVRNITTSLKDDVVRLEELERATGISKRNLRSILNKEPPAGYVLLGDELVRVALLEKLKGKLRGGMRYPEAVALLREHGIRSENAFRYLGFKVVWRGINPEKATLVRDEN
ncbi:MAG: putative nuclease of restriction endonuclease-like superfamily [Candidatus Alkanophagales archaeon MCA70_species_1]|nr:putative nuclease of restriction endonuclease-like superfamily [Candidatus Alkanophaga volatiphilum]